ncbi:MAG: helix-turn-helix transcriptional regulator [Nitriliruptorales bacterium]
MTLELSPGSTSASPQGRGGPRFPTPASPRSMLCPHLVGRAEDVAALGRALDEAWSGRGRTLFLLGEAGVGKTRLANHLAAEASRRQLTVLYGRAVESDQTTAFRALADALQACFRKGELPDSPELEPYLPGLAWILPDLRRHVVAPAEEPLIVVSEGVLRLLRVLGNGRGTVLILEDMHWADAETLAVIEYLTDHLGDQPALCLVSVRSEIPSRARLLARGLTGRRASEALDLRPLTDTDITTMACACLGVDELPAGLPEYLVEHAEGVPFLVEELLAASVACGALIGHSGTWSFNPYHEIPVPESFADSLRRRISLISGPAFEILSAAAVLGRSFDWELLPAVTSLDEEAVLNVLRAATGAQLLELSLQQEPDQAVYRFRHALTRDVMVRHLLPSERAILARRAVETLEASRPDLPGEWCLLAARLCQEAGEPIRAASLHLKAARRSFVAGDLASTERLLEVARGLSEGDFSLQIRIDRFLTEVLALMGKTNRVREVGERLLDDLGRLRDAAADLAELHLNLARAEVTATNWLVARNHLEQARHLAESSPGTRLLPRVDALAANMAIGEARLSEAERLARAALELAKGEGLDKPGMAPAACEALEVLGRRARLRSLKEAESIFSRSLEIAASHAMPLWRLRALHELGAIDIFETWRLDRLQKARKLARQEGALATGAYVNLNLAVVHQQRTDLAQAIELAEECEGAARCFGLGLLLPMSLIIQATAHALAPRRSDMETAIDMAQDLSGGDPNVLRGAWGQCRAELSFILDDRERALEELETAMDYIRQCDTDPWPFRGTWVLLRTVLDREPDAARDELRASVGVISRSNRAYLAYADAIAAGQEGRLAEAQTSFAAGEAEMAGLEGASWWRHRARMLVAEAALEDGWGDPVSWLQEAAVVFAEHGYARLVARCRGLLRQAGGALPRLDSSSVDIPTGLLRRGVTGREMDVLVLVAERLSNRQIAKRLIISPRTVEKHVERLMAKTSTKSRTELGTILRKEAQSEG